MSEETHVLKIVAQSLNQAAIPYVVTGSTAVNFYARPRMTRDIDIVFTLKPEDIPRIFDIFKTDFYVDEEMIREAVKYRSLFNVIHNDTMIKVDFIIPKDLERYALDFRRRWKIKVDGVEVSVISPEDLIVSKLFWAKDSLSEMQLEDVRNVLSFVENMDKAYIENQVRALGLEQIYDKVKP